MCRRVEKSRSTSGKGFLLQIVAVRGSLEQSEISSSSELPDYVSSSPYRWCCEISSFRGTSHFTSFMPFSYHKDITYWEHCPTDLSLVFKTIIFNK